jgi:protein TonB
MRSFRRAIPEALLIIFVTPVLAGIALAQNTPSNPCEPFGYTGPVYKVGKDVTEPRIIRTVDPEYTEKARRAKIEGTIRLLLVVDADGNPTTITICEGLGNGLDEKATKAVQQWKFEPGTLHGKPVSVETAVEVDFHLHR